ncbi:helix-turn-helix transcriptional regulator [Tistlia consotensis]|uniref:helix-turn-helix transcriptional regulator n=1 Tax=Tistlia consotensis TaxID=1321365 RepID=UPI001F386489|nr:helix-turn-helix transcriptional regulator [Tistlia consotensis]
MQLSGKSRCTTEGTISSHPLLANRIIPDRELFVDAWRGRRFHQTVMNDGQSIEALSDLGTFIRSRRKAQGLTQRELSVAAGVGLRFVIEVEHGKTTSQVGKVFQLLQVLGVRLAVIGAEPDITRRKKA